MGFGETLNLIVVEAMKPELTSISEILTVWFPNVNSLVEFASTLSLIHPYSIWVRLKAGPSSAKLGVNVK